MSNIIKMFEKNLNEKGMTLVELLIAVVVLSIAMAIASSMFANSIKEQQKIFAKQNVTDNARYITEFMIKEIRMAKAIDSGSKNGIFPSIAFTNSSGAAVTYSFSGNAILRNSGSGDQPISSSEISVSALTFNINNWSSSVAPRVTIFIKAETPASFPQKASAELQTSISPRIY